MYRNCFAEIYKPIILNSFLTKFLAAFNQVLHLTGMNKKLLVLVSIKILVLLPAMAQVKKVYAYKQASIPGIQPRTITAEGGSPTQLPERKATYNYWFYVSHIKTTGINITALWIGGKKYSAKTETISKLPVIKINYTAASADDTVTLVPATKNAITLTYPAGEDNKPENISKYLSNLINTHELVIAYYWKGRKYYAVKNLITRLTPEAQP